MREKSDKMAEGFRFQLIDSKWSRTFCKPAGERYERASLSSPFLKKRGYLMKSIIRMPLEM